MYPVSPQDPWVQVAEVVRLIRQGKAQTRPELADATRLGRNVITQRIEAAQGLGLVQPSGQQRSRGGRGAEVWEFVGDQGRILVAMVGPDELRIAMTDLSLRIIEERRVDWDLTADPLTTCEKIAGMMDELREHHHVDSPPWGVGIGMPAPIDYSTGRSTEPVASGPTGTDWAKQMDVRTWFVRRMQAPVWIDSVSNLAALGAAAQPGAPEDLVFVRMGRSVSSGIISDGRLHRGADWIAGEIAHITVHPDSERICLCGRVGCLDAFASQWAIETEAHRMVAQSRGGHLGAAESPITLGTVVAGAEGGDPTCVELVLRAADAMGRALAGVVTWFNPRRVVIGGNALASTPLFHGMVTRTLNAYALAASVRKLELQHGRVDGGEEILGAAALVTEWLLSPEYMAEWAPGGFPIDVEKLLVARAVLA